MVSKRQPTFDEITDLQVCLEAVKHVKSNAIVLAKQLRVVGVGAGQMKRVDSRRAGGAPRQRPRASARCWPPTPTSPSPTAWSVPLTAGVTAIIQPGGSIRDDEAIRAADSQGVAMVFTGTRHFKH